MEHKLVRNKLTSIIALSLIWRNDRNFAVPNKWDFKAEAMTRFTNQSQTILKYLDMLD